MALIGRVTPPVVDSKYVSHLISSIRSHLNAMISVHDSVNDFFDLSIYEISRASPDQLKEIYDRIIPLGHDFASAFKSFASKIVPIIKTGQDLLAKHKALEVALDEYRAKMVAVRKEETEENIRVEGEALQNFVQLLDSYNTDSNNLALCLVMLYNSCVSQFSYDFHALTDQMGEFLSIPEVLEPSQEEKDLESYIASLEKEISELPSNETEKVADEKQTDPPTTDN